MLLMDISINIKTYMKMYTLTQITRNQNAYNCVFCFSELNKKKSTSPTLDRVGMCVCPGAPCLGVCGWFVGGRFYFTETSNGTDTCISTHTNSADISSSSSLSSSSFNSQTLRAQRGHDQGS